MSEFAYNGISVDVQEFEFLSESDAEESKKHLEHDFAVLLRENIDSIIKERFIPWLKGDDYEDKDTDRIFDGLEVYEITYHYGKIIAEYSPTGKEDYFGQFEFEFESSDEYTEDMLESVAMEVYVLGDEIVSVDGYDI